MSYISGIGCISPQNTIDKDDFLSVPVNQNALFLQCIQPESYKDYINPVLSRRLSRIIKMGITSALISIKEAGIEDPGAIITGTGLGCVEDTEKFLMTMIDNNETLLNPTNFMQSTYNTISSQIAIILKCFNYNSTYVHRGFSFESALTDALDLIKTGDADSALVGGIDEFTENHFQVTSLLGDWRQKAENNFEMIHHSGPATIPGEGSVFFTLTRDTLPSSYARLQGVKTVYKPKNNRVIFEAIEKLLNENNLTNTDIDLLVAGLNGNNRTDIHYHDVINNTFSNTPVVVFKNLCGEYHTASAFGLWLASNIIKHQVVPPVCMYNSHAPSGIKHLLLYNHYAAQQHSLMLISMV